MQPANVLVGPPVKLADLGFSKLQSDSTAMKTKIGTTDYMAPELIMISEEETYGAQIDLWSLGVITYELVAPHNERPFLG